MADEYKRIALSFETHAALKAEKEARGVTWQRLFVDLLEPAGWSATQAERLRELEAAAAAPAKVTVYGAGLPPEELREQVLRLMMQVPEYRRQGPAFMGRILDEWLGAPVSP